MAVADQFETVQKLYIAFYQRPADFAGRQFWAEQVEAQGLQSVINAFATSDESEALYGEINNDTIGDVIDAIYQAAFGRAADAEGKAWYVAEFEAGNFTAATIALNVVNGAVDADATVLGNKVQAADLFTTAVEGVDYNEADIAAARDFLAGVTDTVPTQAEVEAVVAEQIVDGAGSPIEGLDEYVAATEALAAAELAFSDAVVAAGLESDTDADDNGIADDFDPAANDYVLEAESAVLGARTALSNARLSETDAELRTALSDAQVAVNEDTAQYDISGTAYVGAPTGTAYSAAQLQARAVAAQNTLNANIAAGTSTDDLSQQLEDAIALYLTSSSVGATELGGLTTAANDLQGETVGTPAYDAALEAFYLAVDGAYADIFRETATDNTKGVSILAAGERGDAIESLLTTLNTRADLFEAAEDTQDAFEATAEGGNYVSAQEDLAVRQGLIDDVADAQASLVAITAAAEAFESAQQAVADAAEALGYEIEAIDSAVEFGTVDSDLFTFDAEVGAGLGAVVINNLSSDDIVFLGGNYVLGTTGSGNNNVLEVFISESNGNAVLQIENTAFGSSVTGGDFTTITLTGVSAADVQFESGVVSFA